MKLRRLMILLPCLLAAAGVMAGEVYSWRDAEGRLHYSDTPPTGKVDVKKRQTGGTAEISPPADVKPKSLAEKNMEFRKRRSEATEAQTKAAQEKTDAENRQKECQTLRRNLEALDNGNRIARINEKGEQEVIDDSQRLADSERIRKQIQERCK